MTQLFHPSMFWRLWLRSISVRRPQAALAIGSVLVGAAVTSTLLDLYGDVRRKMSQEFRAYGPNVVLSARPLGSGGTDRRAAASTDSRNSAGVIDEDVMRRLDRFRAERSGLGAVPVLYAVAGLRPVQSDPCLPEIQNAVAVGVDFDALRRLYSGWQVRGADGRLDRGACAIGARLASRLRLGVGDSVEIEIAGETAAEGRPGRETYRVASVLSTGASEDDQVFLALPALQRLAGLEDKLSMVQLSVPGETQEIERTLREFSQTFPDLDVRPLRQIVDSEGRVLGTIRWLLFLLTALILIITALCVAATMTAIVLERRKDVAVMKALGASDHRVMRMFLTEGATLGLTGAVAGFILGFFLAQYLAYRLFGVALSLVWWNFPVVCLSMILLALAATVFPVRIVRGVEPARVLKGE